MIVPPKRIGGGGGGYLSAPNVDHGTGGGNGTNPGRRKAAAQPTDRPAAMLDPFPHLGRELSRLQLVAGFFGPSKSPESRREAGFSAAVPGSGKIQFSGGLEWLEAPWASDSHAIGARIV